VSQIFVPQIMNFAGGPPPASCHSKVELRISCNGLMDKDLLSKSDPLCAIYEERNNRWQEIGRTERILNNLNPHFTKSIIIDYAFEEVQKLKFCIYDIDSEAQKLSSHDFLGETYVTLGTIVSNKKYVAPLKMGNSSAGKGRITINADELDNGPKEDVTFYFSASDLDKKDWFGKSDPYLEIYREDSLGDKILLHKTEVIKNTLNPTWRKFSISMQSLSRGNIDTAILVKCYDWDSDGSSDFIGEFRTKVRNLLEANASKIEWDCINPDKRRKKGSKYKRSGIIILNKAVVERQFSFLEYIMGGCQINFTVAIDFTGSNGDPRSPQSLHFINPNYPNQYVAALRSVGTVCQDYDSDKMFPALGFGARLPPDWRVSHEFPLNFNMQNPFCAGIDGVEQAYKNCICQVQLYGPTNFASVIRHVTRFAVEESQKKTASNYYVLLILTDGEITDFEETKEAIVDGSNLPMSIIIVGVGGADFSQMEALDGDSYRLTDRRGRACTRDIVQFVPYRDFLNKDFGDLAKTVLAEVPKQLTNYFKHQKIEPMKRTLQEASAVSSE